MEKEEKFEIKFYVFSDLKKIIQSKDFNENKK